jgi:cob(I)alamin adenosyltransferase
MKIYTKTGDGGTTGLLGPGRVSKDSARIEAYGTVDELNAALGVARAEGLRPEIDTMLSQIQSDLFALGAALADPDPAGSFFSAITNEHISKLENLIDALQAKLPPLDQFILPGGTRQAAYLHLARTICRRAERRVVSLMGEESQRVATSSLVYLNRLSDLLFVMARAANHDAGVADVVWAGL